MEALPRWFGNSPVTEGLYSKVVYPANNSEGDKEGGREGREGGRKWLEGGERGREGRRGGKEGEGGMNAPNLIHRHVVV